MFQKKDALNEREDHLSETVIMRTVDNDCSDTDAADCSAQRIFHSTDVLLPATPRPKLEQRGYCFLDASKQGLIDAEYHTFLSNMPRMTLF